MLLKYKNLDRSWKDLIKDTAEISGASEDDVEFIIKGIFDDVISWLKDPNKTKSAYMIYTWGTIYIKFWYLNGKLRELAKKMKASKAEGKEDTEQHKDMVRFFKFYWGMKDVVRNTRYFYRF